MQIGKILIIAILVTTGCVKKLNHHPYFIKNNGEILARGRLHLPQRLGEEEVWQSLKGLELELWGERDERAFKFKPDENAGKVMTIRGEIRILACGKYVDLRELRFVKQNGTHGGEYITPSGWIIDPKQVPEIVKLAKIK